MSIFKDIDREKTLVAAVMDPNVTDGVGPMVMRLVPKLKTMLDNLRYNGRVRVLEPTDDPDAPTSYNPNALNGGDDGDKGCTFVPHREHPRADVHQRPGCFRGCIVFKARKQGCFNV